MVALDKLELNFKYSFDNFGEMEKLRECPEYHLSPNAFSPQNIILISGSMISSKFQEAFRDENAAKKEEVDGENDVKSGKKLQ